MHPTLTMFITIIATSGVFTAFLCMYTIIKRKEIPSAYTFIIYTATQAIYIFAHAFEMASNTLTEVMRWTILEYIGIGAAPAIGLLIIMQYIGIKLTRLRVGALLLIPAITFLMVVTNDYHHLFYKEMHFREDAPFATTDVVIGQYYIVHGAYIFGCMLAGVVLLLRRWRQTKKAYRLQLLTLIVGQFMPMMGAFLYLVGLTPYGIDPVPMILCITSAMYIWAIVSTRMLTVIPIAKDRIFESMREGAIVLDSADRLVDFNGVVSHMFPGITTEMLGATLDEAWIRLSGSPFPVVRSQDGTQDEFVWRAADGMELFYQIRSSVVLGRGGESIGSLLMLIDVTEQKLLQDQLKQLAYYDGLTKLLNRSEFIRRTKIMLEQAPIGDKTTCIMLFDIDHFKSINDTYGHDVGDLAIQHVVTIVKQVEAEVPDVLLARYGGEEFVIAIPSCTLDDATRVAERIRTELEKTPMPGRYNSIAVTASFGISQVSHHEDTLEKLLKYADMALYQAKRAGRNQVIAFEEHVLAGRDRDSM